MADSMIVSASDGWTDERVKLLQDTVCKDVDKNNFMLFLQKAQRLRLDPFANQICLVGRDEYEGYGQNRKKTGRKIYTTQVEIAGLRLQAERTGQYEGQTPIQWCGEDGVWKDVWLAPKDVKPTAARCGVHKHGYKEPQYRVVLLAEYTQNNTMWNTKPAHMLGKCAEAAALRGAFPSETSGLYIAEEGAVIDTTGESVEPTLAQAARASVSDKLAQREAVKRATNAHAAPKKQPTVPTHTVRSYEPAPGMAFAELGPDALTAYVEFCEAKAAEGPADARAAARAHADAAQAELERRIEAEMAQGAPALTSGDERLDDLRSAINGTDEKAVARERQPGEEG